MGWLEYISGPLSRERFAHRVIADLQAAGDDRQATFDVHEFRLSFYVNDEAVGYANLGNLYSEYVATAGRDHERFFRHAVRSLLATHKPLPEDYTDAQHDILLGVRNRSYFALAEMQSFVTPGAQLSWPHQTLGEHLGVGLVYDLPEAMVMLQGSHLESWGVTFYEVMENALNNLGGLDAGFAAIDDHTYISTTSDHYDASRMLIAELVAELKVKGDPVALLPNRDRLIVTGAGDSRGLETAALVAQQLITHPRPVTGHAFRYHDEEWTPWLPTKDHPAYRLFKSLTLGTRQQDYRQQACLLQDWVSAGALDPCEIAEFRVHESGTRQPPFSYCVWREGLTVLLPKVDRICFLRDNQEANSPLVEGVNVSWAKAERAVSVWLQEEEHFYPVRYRTRGFPTEEVLSAFS